MEAQSGMTFVAPLGAGMDEEAIEARREKIRGIRPVSGELSSNIHFFSACIIFLEDPERGEKKHFAVMEVSFDGSEADMIGQLGESAPLNGMVDTVFGDCQGYPGTVDSGNRKAFLEASQKKQSLFFVGAKDLPVHKIRAQQAVYREAKKTYADFFSAGSNAPTSKLRAWQRLRETLLERNHTLPDGSASRPFGQTIEESADACLLLENNIANPTVRSQAGHLARFYAMLGLYVFTAITLYYSVAGVLPVLEYPLYFAVAAAPAYVVAGVVFVTRVFPRNIANKHKLPLLLYQTLLLVLQGAVIYALLLFVLNLPATTPAEGLEILFYLLIFFLFLLTLLIFALTLRFAAGRPGFYWAVLSHCLAWWAMYELGFGWFSVFCVVSVLELIVIAMAVLGHREGGAFPLRYGIAAMLVHLAIWGYLPTDDSVFIALGALLIEAALLAFGLFYIFFKIVSREFKDNRGGLDQPESRSAPDDNVGRSFSRDIDFGVQNHMVSVTRVKSGPFSAWLMLAVLRLINLYGYFSIRRSQGETSVIHYLRFVILEQGQYKYLLFLSNFDGTWHNYLGEFSVWALNAIWGNTGGFPPTQSLIHGGAANEQEFKRYAANSQVETLTWYSAYNDLTLKEIYAARFTCQYLRYPRRRFLFLPSEFHVKESPFDKNSNLFEKKWFQLREDHLEEATLRCNR